MATMAMPVNAKFGKEKGPSGIQNGPYETFEVCLAFDKVSDDVRFVEQPSTGRMVVRNFDTAKAVEIPTEYRYHVPSLLEAVAEAVGKVV